MTKSVRDIFDGFGLDGRIIIDELWGEGFTILPRQVDPFDIDPRLIPDGIAYQWCTKDLISPAIDQPGWYPVQALRHDGLFAPCGYLGDIEIGGLTLCERPKAEVVAALASATDKTNQNIEDWKTKTGAQFSGHIKTGFSEDTAKTEPVGDELLGSINQTKIPKELTPFILEILHEQQVQLDKLKKTPLTDLGADFSDNIPIDQFMANKTKALQLAIDIIREKHKDDLHEQAAATG